MYSRREGRGGSHRQTAGAVVQPHIVGEEAVIANFPGDVEIVGVPPGETEICHLYPHSLPVTDPAVTKWFQRTLMDGLP